MTVHVWRDGSYVGEVYKAGLAGIGVRADDKDESEKIKKLVLAEDFIEVRAGGEKHEVEFPTEEWISLASLLLLPPAGYRVHIIQDATNLPPK